MNWGDLIKRNKEDWLLLMIEVDEQHFKNYYNTPSKLYKDLSNSKRSVGGMTNREYFKRNVTGGFYSVEMGKGIVKVLLCLEGCKIHPLQINVRVRKLLLHASVRILKFEEILDWDFEGSKNQLVGQHYFSLQKTF